MATVMNHRLPVHEPAADPLPLENGDHLDQPTFHRLYEAMPAGFKCELIGGIVYMQATRHATRVQFQHGRAHAYATGWLFNYSGATPGTDLLNHTTHILGIDSELQPDATLLIETNFGGRSRLNDDGYVVGSPELILEIASSSKVIDLGKKKADYEKAGVQEYVVVLTQEERVVWFVRKGKKFADLKPGADGIFRSRIFPGLWLAPEGITPGVRGRLSAVGSEGLASSEHAAFVEKLRVARTASSN